MKLINKEKQLVETASKRELKQQAEQKKKIEKEQQKDLKLYGIPAGEIKYEKEKGVKKSYKPLFKCLSFVKEFKWQIVLIGIIALFLAVVSCGYPLFTQQIVDNTYHGNLNTALMLLIGFFGLSIVNLLFSILWDLLSTRVTLKVSKKFQNLLISDLTKTQIKKFDTTNSGAILTRINSDTNTIISSVFQIIDNLFYLLRAFGYLIVFFVVNIWLGVVFVLTMIIYYFFDIIYQNIKYKYQKKIAYLDDQSYGITNEIARGVRDIKVLNISEEIKRKHNTVIGNKFKAMWDNTKRNQSAWGLREVVFTICKFACIGFAFFLFTQNQISIGSVVLCIFYSGMALDLVLFFSTIKSQAKTSLVSAERIVEIMEDDYPKERFGTLTLENFKGQIEFKNVEFAYEKDKPLFNNLSFKILPNECVGFVGKSGEGKSTILSLIPKLYDLQAGQILLDDTDISTLTENSLRENICAVSQSPYIFNLSVKENMQLSKHNATNEEIEDACQKAYLADFIESLPKKYNTQVGEGGVQLSGGQKQRLAIARALLRDSKVILFDEATSALDNESQEFIKKAIKDLQKNKTIVIVAHRLSTVKDCDKIFVVANNKIVGEGSHNELLATCKEYNDLYLSEENKPLN